MAVTCENGMLGLIQEVFTWVNEEANSTQGGSRVSAGSQWQALLGPSRGIMSRSPQMVSISRSFEEQLTDCSNLQNLKDVIQEFMEVMYSQMETEIYKKFNTEMKRIVLKYREAEKISKKVQQQLVHHADYFEAERKWQQQRKELEQAQSQLKEQLAQAEQ